VVHCWPEVVFLQESALKEERVAEILLGLTYLTVAILLAALTAYLSFYLFQALTRDLDEWEELRQGNPAVGIVLGAVIIAIAIILKPTLEVNTALWDVGQDLHARLLLAQAIQIALGLVLSAIALALAVMLFVTLTRGIDEIAELKRGNLAIAGLLAGVLVGVGLMISQAVGQITTLVSSVLF
jgi:uncharacterized membrane protein YjfL (UPF0719 family)